MIREIQDGREAARARRDAILADFRATFGSEQGRRVLAVLEAAVNYGKPSFLPGPGGGTYDPLAAAIRDGRKSVVAEIHGFLEAEEDMPSTRS